jgi:hypothetical protein
VTERNLAERSLKGNKNVYLVNRMKQFNICYSHIRPSAWLLWHIVFVYFDIASPAPILNILGKWLVCFSKKLDA